jgi:hypothetical protein
VSPWASSVGCVSRATGVPPTARDRPRAHGSLRRFTNPAPGSRSRGIIDDSCRVEASRASVLGRRSRECARRVGTERSSVPRPRGGAVCRPRLESRCRLHNFFASSTRGSPLGQEDLKFVVVRVRPGESRRCAARPSTRAIHGQLALLRRGAWIFSRSLIPVLGQVVERTPRGEGSWSCPPPAVHGVAEASENGDAVGRSGVACEVFRP